MKAANGICSAWNCVHCSTMLPHDRESVLLLDRVQPRKSGLLVSEQLAGVVDQVQRLVLVHGLNYCFFPLPLSRPRCEARGGPASHKCARFRDVELRVTRQECIEQRDEVALARESGQEWQALLFILRVFCFCVAREPKKRSTLERGFFLPAQRVNFVSLRLLQMNERLLNLSFAEILPAVRLVNAKLLD